MLKFNIYLENEGKQILNSKPLVYRFFNIMLYNLSPLKI